MAKQRFLARIYSSGVKLADTENFKDSSDISRDRLWTGVGIQSLVNSKVVLLC